MTETPQRRSCHEGMPEILDIIGTVKGKNAMIVDDFSISGGTLVSCPAISSGTAPSGSTRAFPISRSARRAPADHGERDRVRRLDGLGAVRAVDPGRFRIVLVAPLFAEVVSRMHRKLSISDLVDELPRGAE